MDEKLVKSFLTFLRGQESQLTRNNSPDYNVFKVINKAMLLEDQTNCALLIDWLDPRGHHGEGCLFLRKFLPLFGVGIEHLDHAAWEVLDHPGFSCGFPDIVIQNKQEGYLFFVEFKVKSEDHSGQLHNYHEYLRTRSDIRPERKKLVYLTVDGRDPANFPNVPECSGHFMKLSLQDDVQKWLMSALPEIRDNRVRNTITNYLAILPEIIDEVSGKKIEQEIVRLLSLPHLKPLALFVYQNHAKIFGFPTDPRFQARFRPGSEITTFLEQLKNGGFVTQDKGANGKAYPIQFFADTKDGNVRIGLRWLEAPSDRILELPDFDELKYWLINSAYYIPDPYKGQDIAWRNMGPLPQQTQLSARLHEYFERFVRDFTELVTRINKSLSLQEIQTTISDNSGWDFDCSVCKSKLGHNYINGLRYCDDCRPGNAI